MKFIASILLITITLVCSFAYASPESKLAKYDKKISTIDKEIYQLNQKSYSLNQEMEKLEKKEANLRKKLRSNIDIFNKTAVKIARIERMPTQAMAVAENLRSGHMRQGVVSQGRQSLSNDISNNRSGITELQKIWEKKKQNLFEVTDLQAKLAEKKTKLEFFFQRQLELLALTNKQKADLIAKAHNSKKQGKLENLFDASEFKRKYSSNIRKTYKKLPVQGNVIHHYGQKNKEGFPSKGLTIKATSGGSVNALADGRVIYTGVFRKYGFMVILEHGLNIHTLYSGLQSSNHQVGDFIRADSSIGNLPSINAPELYVEVRKRGEAINPKPWLAKR